MKPDKNCSIKNFINHRTDGFCLFNAIENEQVEVDGDAARYLAAADAVAALRQSFSMNRMFLWNMQSK
uniref:Uncharacterized protein n=1 Tax=Syphacia muris TaxID=451379 RepID=A0A0N5A859_9BILA